jgi:microcystin-dependent protein
MDQFVGQIVLAGFNFAPAGWHFCDGSLLPISQYDVLFNLIGTTFGGDGVNTFALPDLRGRTAVGQGTGPGLSTYVMGQISGSEFVTISSQTYPSHNHLLSGTTADGNAQNPTGAVVGTGVNIYKDETPTLTMNGAMCGPATGLGNPHENRQPYQVCNWIISLFGIYPSQG